MRLTNTSNNFIKIISKINNKKNNTINSNSNDIFLLFYYLLSSGYNYLQNNQIILEPILTNKLLYPTMFSSSPFKPIVEKAILAELSLCISYSIFFLDKKITIHFFVSNNNINLNDFNNYVKNMLVWIYIVSFFTNNKNNCLQNTPLIVYIYHTSLEKRLPSTRDDILDIQHVNTAFTLSCSNSNSKSEIVIFRREEWFKVFIHETFHTFGLDFSVMDNTECDKLLLSLFSVNSDINLYEAYSEFWARIINVFFCSYLLTNNRSNFHNLTKTLIQMETFFSSYQAVKVLRYMDLNYEQLIENNETRNKKYKENTNVLSYYILTNILLTNWQDFFKWCQKNNGRQFIQFKQTKINIKELCNFIKIHYKTSSFLQQMKYYENMFNILKGHKILKNTLRMSLSELK